ncbi:MAG: hypothetical protein FWC76_07665 [Defluviitaleaceae bacterium]|nr:hypothetical protein [Defluviitaleaceae bacterium]
MRIALAIFAVILILLLAARCSSGSEAYEFSWVRGNETISALRQFYEIEEIFWFTEEGVSFRGRIINAEDSPFDGEVIVFLGEGIMIFREYKYTYQILGNRLFFDIQIDAPDGMIIIEDMWAFGFGRAAAQINNPLHYLFTVAILHHTLYSFLPRVNPWVVTIVIAAFFIYVAFNKKLSEKQNAFLVKLFSTIVLMIGMLHLANMIWRF